MNHDKIDAALRVFDERMRRIVDALQDESRDWTRDEREELALEVFDMIGDVYADMATAMRCRAPAFVAHAMEALIHARGRRKRREARDHVSARVLNKLAKLNGENN